MILLLVFFSARSVEMYHMSTDDLPQLFLANKLTARISCISIKTDLIFPFLFCVVVEIDIPWDNSAVESYGRSFTSWTEDNFKKLTKTFVNTLVATPFAFVLFLVTFF